MKRMISLLTAALLMLSLAAPALADVPEEEPVPEAAMAAETVPEEGQDAGMDAELAELASLVKQTLQIDDDYTQFTGDYYDGTVPYWSLYWSDDVRHLGAEVLPDGTVLNVYFDQDSGSQNKFSGFDPVFPAVSREEAEAQAQDWFDRLFTGPETARVDDTRTVLGEDGCYRFDGTVEKNGLPSPVVFTLCLSDAGLTSFYRSDSYGGYVGELPGAEPETDEDAAGASLAGAVELELRWVSDGDGGAVLRYMPVGPYTVVDAQSGEAVDMDALYEAVNGAASRNGMYAGVSMKMAEEAAADGGAALTEVELSSISNYGDAMDQDALDEALREITALGLDGFSIQKCSYSMDGETGDVTASIRYTGEMTEEQLYGFSADQFQQLSDEGADMTIYKYVTVDAKTGALQSVSTGYPLWERDGTVTMTRAVRSRAAENFLGQVAPERAETAELCTLKGYNEGDTLTYAQVHQGDFYPDNFLSVTVNPGAGTVDEFYCDWEDVTFGPAEDVVPAMDAAAAYTDALDVTLGYVAWPVDITREDDAIYARYLEQGYTYVEELRLGYYYDGTDETTGVDALTGEVLRQEQSAGEYVYDDLDGVAQAPAIEALAQAGVGFAGGSFLPEAELTQREAVMLLLQADGRSVRPDAEDDTLLEQALWRGFVTEEDWAPDEAVTCMGFIRMMLGASRFGDGARLLELGDGEGYNVMALALGMDTSDPDGTVTRADAAELLYRFMSR